MTYSYDALGDITYKSDTGSYSYAGSGPHAVTSVTGPAPGTYAYDADGNMTNRNGTNITWNSLNMPVCINAGGGTCTGGSNWSQFAYAPDKHRYYQTAMINGVSETTVYAGGYEAITRGGTPQYRNHLMADGREVAEVDLSNSGSTVNETVSYVLTDHLGSVDVITSQTGAVIADMSFGAFGNRRAPGTWLPPVGSAETAADHAADRYGFTHQEMLDNVGLIHMNGRVYDSSLGRFLSVDPVFEFPTNTQSLNPYSYVLNNPLSMTDPTGYAASCSSTSTNGTSCAEQHVSYTPTGSHIAISGTLRATSIGNGSIAVTASNRGLANAFKAGAKAMFGSGNGQQNSQQGPNSLYKTTKSLGAGTSPTAQSIPTHPNDKTSDEKQRHIKFVDPTGKGVRNDPTGGGYYDSPRLDPWGRIRMHHAVDFLATPGQNVLAPISGKATREVIVYGNRFLKANPKLKMFRGIMIVNKYGWSAKLFYMLPNKGIIGSEVNAGNIIGTAQNRAQFTPNMQNHVHMELRDNGKLVDPLKYITPP